MYVRAVEESRRERKKRLTKQRIVKEAVRLFAEQGYEQTTVAQIAAASDVDPKTFFNYFPSKDAVLFADVERDVEVLYAAIARRGPDEGPGAALVRMVEEYAAHRRPQVPAREAEELSEISRLYLETPALQAKGLYLMAEVQRRVTDALAEAYPGLDPVTAAAMVGALVGAIQQATLESVRRGRSQKELWESARRAADLAARGLLAVREDGS